MSIYFDNPLRVAVLRGGTNHTHSESLRSGLHFIEHIPDSCYVDDLIVTKEGSVKSNDQTVSNVLSRIHIADVVFSALLPPYSSSLDYLFKGSPTVIGSSISTTRVTNNTLSLYNTLKQTGLGAPSHEFLNTKGYTDIIETIKEEKRSFTFPLIVKAFVEGGFFTLGVAENDRMLSELLLYSQEVRSEKILLEQYIEGRISAVAVAEGLRGESYYVTTPLSFWNGDLEPGLLSTEEKKHISTLARYAFRVLGLRHYGVFYFVLAPSENPYIVKIETHPAFHPNSDFSILLNNVGVTSHEFVAHLLGFR